MEEKKSNSKIRILIFAVAIIAFCMGSAIGLSYSVGKSKINADTIGADAVHRANAATEICVAQQIDEFQKSAVDSAVKQKAARLHELSQNLCASIMQLRFEVIAFTDGETEAVMAAQAKAKSSNTVPYVLASDIQSKDCFDKVTYYMLGIDGEQNSRATQLKHDIDAYRTEIVKLLPNEQWDALQNELSFLYTFDREPRPGAADGKWETYYFDHIILVAAATNLEALAGDVMMAEAIVLKYLSNQK